MNKLFNTILLSVALVCCGNVNASNKCIYNPLYDLDGIFLNKCKVETSGDNTGQIYYQIGRRTPKKSYLIDEEGRPFLDLKTVVEKQSAGTVIPNFLTNGNGNLIIKECDGPTGTDATTYTLTNTLKLAGGNTALIVPKGITLNGISGLLVVVLIILY